MSSKRLHKQSSKRDKALTKQMKRERDEDASGDDYDYDDEQDYDEDPEGGRSKKKGGNKRTTKQRGKVADVRRFIDN